METQRIRATPTPKKRAFGNALPTNSPFPRQRQQTQSKSAKKQLQWSDKKQSTSSTTAISEVQQSSRRKRSNRNNSSNNNDHLRAGNSLLSTPYNTKTPTKVIREGTPSVKWSIPEATITTTQRRKNTSQRSSKKQPTTPGRVNLFQDFNSPLVPSTVATPGVVKRQFDSSQTQKLTYAKIAASSPRPGTPTESAAIAEKPYPPMTPPASQLLSSNTPLSAASTSPSTLSVQSNSTTGTALAINATSTDVPESIAPSEYVIEFPPGPLHLKFDPVVYTLGKPMGCCVKQILPDFNTNLSCIRMEGIDNNNNATNTEEAAAATIIQVNDLIVSINGTNVLSRKFDVITDLLHKLDGSHKTIVFRSIEKVWKSQFQRKTMRNLRSGRRVATALSTDEMERDLHSWVETPTKVEVGKSGGRDNDRRNNVVIGDNKLESITENEVQTPNSDTGSKSSSIGLFSPSNVKKVMSERSDAVKQVLSATPKASPKQVEKSNLTPGDENQGSAVKTTKQSPINQISKALVGGNNSEQEFERSLRLKQSVLKELNGVCLELGEKYFSDEEVVPESDADTTESESVKEDILPPVEQLRSKDVDKEEVSLLEERVRELTSALASAEDEARVREDDLEDQLQQLRSQLSSKNSTVPESDADAIVFENTKEDILPPVEQVRSKDVDKEVRLLEERVQELTSALATAEDESRERENDLEDQLQQLQSQLSSKINADHEEEVRRLKEEKEQAVKEVQQQLEKERAEQVRSKNTDKEVLLLEERVQELTSALATAEDESREREDDFEDQLQQLQSHFSSKINAHHEGEVRRLKEEKEQAVKEVQQQLEKERAEQVRSKNTDKEVRLLEERVQELISALATAEDEAREREDDLEDQLQQLQSQLSSKINADHEEEVRRLKEEKEQAVKEVQQQLEKERTFFQERVAKGKKSKQELIGKLDATQSELQKNKALCAELEKTNMSKKEMKAKLKASSTLIQSLQEEKDKLVMELQTLQQNLSERDVSEKEKQAEFEQKAAELEKMVEEMANLKSERDAADEEKHAELESLSTSLKEKAAELEKMVEEVTNLKHHLSLSEKKSSADRVALKANKSKLVEECEQLKAQLVENDQVRNELHSKVEEQDVELSRRQVLLNGIKKRNYSLQEMIDELNETLERSGKDASEQVGFLERKLQTLKQELEESRSISAQHHNHAMRQGEEKQQMQERLAKVTEELEAHRVSLLEKEKLSSENEFLDERVGELTESLAKAEHDAKERESFLEKKLEIVKMELDEMRSASDMRQDEIQRLKKEKQHILEDADSKYDAFKKQLSAKESEMKLLSKQAEEERASLEDQLGKENALKMGLLQKLEATKVEHTESLSRRQELLDDMEKHNALLKQRVGELTNCLATSEDDARERGDALEDKLQQMRVELEEAKSAYNQKYASHEKDLGRVEAEKEAALQEMRGQMEAERISFNERVEREESSKAEVKAELESTEKNNALLKQRVGELTDCLAKAEDDAREREDSLEEKLKQTGIEFEEAVLTSNQKYESLMEEMKLVKAEKETTLHKLHQQMETERLSFSKCIETEERSKKKVMAELDATKDDLIKSEELVSDMECRQKDVLKSMETKISELTITLEKAHDDAKEREYALQEEMCQLVKKIDAAKATSIESDTAHQHEIQRIEDEKRVILNENTKFQEQLDSLMNKLEIGENMKNDLKGRVDALDKAKSFYEKSLSRRQELLDDMEARNTVLKQRVDELTDCLAKAEDDAREREDALEERLLQMGMEFETAKSSFAKENTAHAEVIHQLEEQKEELSSQIGILRHERDDLKDEISVLEQTISDAGTQLQQIEASNAESERQVKELSEKFDVANQDVARWEELCADLKSKLETAERLLDESDAEMNTLSYDCDCLEKQVDNLNAQLESQNKMISENEGLIESLRTEISLLTKENVSLSEDLESQMAKVLLSEDEKSDLVAKIDSLESDMKTAEAEKMQLLFERDSLKSTADERFTQLRQLEEKAEIRQSELLDSLRAKEFEIASLTSQRGELECNFADLSSRFNQLKDQSKKESESFKNRQDQLMNEISTVSVQNESYVMQIKSLEANIGRIKAQLKNEKETHEKTERQLLMDIRNSQNSISGAKLKQSHVEDEAKSLKSKLIARESEISNLVEEKERLDSELRNSVLKLDAEVKASATSQKEHVTAVKELEADVERERALCVDLTSRFETLSSAMASKEEEVSSLKHELSCANEAMRLLQSQEKMSRSSLESKLIDTRTQFEAERTTLKEHIFRLEADASESQQKFLTEKTSSIEAEARLGSQIEIIKAELSSAKKTEEGLRKELNDVNALLREKNYEIEELSNDVLSEKEDRRQELFEMKCLYEKKIQELTASSLDNEAEKSILETKVERLTQDVAVSREKESSDANRIQDLEHLLQRQNEDLLKVSNDMTAKTVAHETALTEMEKNYAWNVKELKQLHDAERSELIQQMSDTSDKLRLCQEKLDKQITTQQDDKLLLENDREIIDELRLQLEEGLNLNDSLSTKLKERDRNIEVLRQDLKLKEESLFAANRQFKAQIEEITSSHAAEKQSLAEEVEKFSSELDWSLDQIDKRQSIIESQRLSLNDENNELVKELSKASNTEMMLRKSLHEVYMQVQQLSVESSSTRSDIVLAIDEARDNAEETLQHAAQAFKAAAAKWAAEKVSQENEIKTLSNDIHELSNRDKHLSSRVEQLQSSLEERGRTIKELSDELASTKASLSAASVDTDRAKDLASQVENLQLAIESRDQKIEYLSIHLNSVNKDLCAANGETQRISDNLECVMNQLDEMVETNEELQEEISRLENANHHMQSLHDSEKDILQSEIESLLADKSDKLVSMSTELDAMILTNEKLRHEISSLVELKQLRQDTFEAEKVDLQSRIDSLQHDLTVAQDELRQIRANADRTEQEREAKSDKLVSMSSELDAMILTNEKLRHEISSLVKQKQLRQDTFEAEKVALQSRIDSLENELYQTRANAERMEQERAANAETALNDLDDMKLKNELLLDEVNNLKSDLQACQNSLETQRGRYESNIASLSTELKSSSERFEAEKESFKAEWRHFQLLLKHLIDSIEGEADAIKVNSSTDSADLPDISSQLGTLIRLVGKKEESILKLKSQIEGLEFDLRDAKIVRDRLIHHDQMEEDLETNRFLSEIEEARVKVIGMDRRLVSERSKRKELETKLSAEGKNQAMFKEELFKKQSTIDELQETVELNSVEIERLESQLCKNVDLRVKLEGKCEEAKSELATYHNIATELKQTIIDKNQDIESKEGRIMELQFQVDDLTAQVEGWKASLQGLTSEADGWKNVLQNFEHDIQDDDSKDSSEILSTSFDRHDELSKEIAKLEEKMLVMEEDHGQQSSMHKSIVDGLEAKCNMLLEENTEALSYISSLEDSKTRLQSKIDFLKKECDVQHRRLSELEPVFDIMKQQKSVSENLCDEVLSGLRKLTEVAIMYSSRLDGFSEEISSPTSWSLNLEYISRFIECALKLNQKYLLDIQRLETTIAVCQSGGVPVFADAITPKAKGSGVRSQESTIMPEHLDMINEIKNMKIVIKNVMSSPKLTPMKAKEMTNNTEEDGDLYSDLLMAYEQLENLSQKIETYQEEQLQWKEKESTLQSRIEKLEEEKLQLESAPNAENQPLGEVENAKQKEASTVMISDEHLNIVKGMARELNSTREKVQLLKSTLGKDAN